MITINGIDLLSKSILSIATNSGIATAIFTTKAINLKFKVLNTADPLCTTTNPTATVIMSDVT